MAVCFKCPLQIRGCGLGCVVCSVNREDCGICTCVRPQIKEANDRCVAEAAAGGDCLGETGEPTEVQPRPMLSDSVVQPDADNPATIIRKKSTFFVPLMKQPLPEISSAEPNGSSKVTLMCELFCSHCSTAATVLNWESQHQEAAARMTPNTLSQNQPLSPVKSFCIPRAVSESATASTVTDSETETQSSQDAVCDGIKPLEQDATCKTEQKASPPKKAGESIFNISQLLTFFSNEDSGKQSDELSKDPVSDMGQSQLEPDDIPAKELQEDKPAEKPGESIFNVAQLFSFLPKAEPTTVPPKFITPEDIEQYKATKNFSDENAHSPSQQHRRHSRSRSKSEPRLGEKHNDFDVKLLPFFLPFFSSFRANDHKDSRPEPSTPDSRHRTEILKPAPPQSEDLNVQQSEGTQPEKDVELRPADSALCLTHVSSGSPQRCTPQSNQSSPETKADDQALPKATNTLTRLSSGSPQQCVSQSHQSSGSPSIAATREDGLAPRKVTYNSPQIGIRGRLQSLPSMAVTTDNTSPAKATQNPKSPKDSCTSEPRIQHTPFILIPSSNTTGPSEPLPLENGTSLASSESPCKFPNPTTFSPEQARALAISQEIKKHNGQQRWYAKVNVMKPKCHLKDVNSKCTCKKKPDFLKDCDETESVSSFGSHAYRSQDPGEMSRYFDGFEERNKKEAQIAMPPLYEEEDDSAPTGNPERVPKFSSDF